MEPLDVGTLFAIDEKEEEKVFTFHDLFWEEVFGSDSDHTTSSRVTFIFLYGKQRRIESTMSLRGHRLTFEHQHALFCIGMCVLPWYWMGYGCERIVINSNICPYSSSLLEFWQTLYSNVLLEFLHCNKAAEFPKLFFSDQTFTGLPVPLSISTSCRGSAEEDKEDSEGSVLVPIGGGKDSLVVWHLNSKRGRRVDLFYVTDETEDFSRDWRLQEISRLTESRFLVVRHNFDYDLIQRISRSYLTPTGHPWAALCLFDATLMALLNGHREVHMGNEKSADEGNHISFAGVEINHQYDKSSQFLALAARYVCNFLCTDLFVSSPLDSLWELEVAEIFCSSALAPFHSVFLSCNSSKTTATDSSSAVLKQWCNGCEKCVFVFLLLSAYLPPPAVTQIFGKDLFRCPELEPVFLSVLGLSVDGVKPFECIGTPEESLAALLLTLRQYRLLQRQTSSVFSGETGAGDDTEIPEMILRLVSKTNRPCPQLELGDWSGSPKDLLLALTERTV